jgi:hypothetical protein
VTDTYINAIAAAVVIVAYLTWWFVWGRADAESPDRVGVFRVDPPKPLDTSRLVKLQAGHGMEADRMAFSAHEARSLATLLRIAASPGRSLDEAQRDHARRPRARA